MTGRVRILEGALVDQIAAGEVVERPASVVKELLENAQDAGARSITVEIEDGGIGVLRVTDDGHGMSPEDAALAVRRHATSKIASAADLTAIRTLGFRGEALPSIASVSRFILSTRPAGALAGTRVHIEGGSDPSIREIGCAPGTSVEVRDLFFNVPARRKFLKSRATESAHIGEVCLRVALVHPAVRLVLLRDGKRTREYLPVAGLFERAQGVFPGDRLAAIEAERDGIRVRAFLGAPEGARSGAVNLHTFVNGRPVRDRALARSIAFAYGSVLPPGRFPTGAVHVELDPSEVDVNVHPQKAEVRFARGHAVLDAITRMLAAELGTVAFGGPAARSQSFWDKRLEGGADPWGLSAALGTTTVRETSPPAYDEDTASTVAPSTPHVDVATPEPDARAVRAESPPELLEGPGFFGALRVLGQVRRMLIVCEGADGLYVIDQHAADERVRFHGLRAAFRAREVTTQRLLFPERVECAPSEVAIAEEAHAELAALGLECSLLGPTTIAVTAVPALLRRAAPERLLRDALGELTRSGERGFGDAIDTVIATMACHGAIRAGDPLSSDECSALLRAVDAVDDFAGHCPHGRPIVYRVGFGELERRLGR